MDDDAVKRNEVDNLSEWIEAVRSLSEISKGQWAHQKLHTFTQRS
jgi:hypothetical protein